MSTVIETRGLEKYFQTPRGALHAVDGVTIKIEEGKTMGVVGESGCGKSTLGRTIIHLHESTGGQILFKGQDVTHVKGHALNELKSNMQIIFQDPYASLNPRMTIDQTVREPLVLSKRYTKNQIDDEVEQLMGLVGIDSRMRNAYPHELDGGRRQRVGIARAIALNPAFVVCDEPVSALDVSIQAQVLNLLQDLQKARGLTYMFVTHDLSVVRHISDDICVMYLGQLVETSPSKPLFKSPLHPYTKALLSAIPSINIHKEKTRIVLKGEITSPINPKPGCRFFARCPYAVEQCNLPQVLDEILPKHFVACCRCRELNGL